MQVAGQYHAEKFPGGTVRHTSVRENLDIGAQVLKEYLARERGNERRALLRYNGSLHISDKYYRKVTRFKQRLGRGLADYHDKRSPS
jgi:soluble lytic murein transglycosylase-like protein